MLKDQVIVHRKMAREDELDALFKASMSCSVTYILSIINHNHLKLVRLLSRHWIPYCKIPHGTMTEIAFPWFLIHKIVGYDYHGRLEN